MMPVVLFSLLFWKEDRRLKTEGALMQVFPNQYAYCFTGKIADNQIKKYALVDQLRFNTNTLL